MPEQRLFARYRFGTRGSNWCVAYYGDPNTPRVVTNADGFGIYYTSEREAQQAAEGYAAGVQPAWISIAGRVIEVKHEQAQQEPDA